MRPLALALSAILILVLSGCAGAYVGGDVGARLPSDDARTGQAAH